MQGTPPWFTPTSSALQNRHSDSSNYFYSNYNQPWERSGSRYQSDYYTGSGTYPMNNSVSHNNMRNCNASQGFGSESQNYPCPPMYFRQDNIEGSSPSVRPRLDRNQICNQSGSLHGPGHPPSMNRIRHMKYPCRSDVESENFSSVFTQSLTSLYSQDAEGNFEEKTFKCEPEDPPTESELNSCPRLKTENLSNGCNPEYNFGSTYNNDVNHPHHHPPPPGNAFENLKIKTEYPTVDDSLRYDNYSMEESYQKRRRSLADAYNRKRKRASTPSISYRASSTDSIDSKTPDMFHTQSQWIPNSIPGCQTDTSNDTYQMHGYMSPNRNSSYDSFENGRIYKRQIMKPRGTRGRPSNANKVRVENAIKRIPKKVSPLTVYAKILDDRILEVTCRRFKKRTKPHAHDDISGQFSSESYFPRNNETWETLCESVEKIVKGLVDRAAILSAPKRNINISRVTSSKAKELLFRLCADYRLDFEDFWDFDEILKSDITSQCNETNQRVRRRMTEDKEEVSIKKCEKKIEKEEVVEQKRERSKESSSNSSSNSQEKNHETQTVTKPERKTNRPKRKQAVKDQPRVLRNLPSRQPANKTSKKTKKVEKQVKNRYPKRKGTRGKGGKNKKLKLFIDLSKDNEQAEVLELESDSSRLTSNPGQDKDEEDDEEECEIKENDDILNSTKEKETAMKDNNGSIVQDEQKSESEDVINKSENKERENSISLENKASKSPDSFSFEFKDVEKTLKNMKKEVEDEDAHLRQPPQLVCMAPDDGNVEKLYLESSQSKSSNSKNTTEDRLSPMYLQANNVDDTETPSPPKLKRTSTKFSQNFSGESNSSDFMAIDSDDPDDKLVIDMEANEHHPNKSIKVEKLTDDKDSEVSHCNQNTPEVPAVDKNEENSKDDDCVVISSENTKTKAPVEIIDLVLNKKPKVEKDKHSLLKEKLLEKPILKQVKDHLMEIEKKALSAGMGSGQTKAEQDESILRTLLLESEVMASNALPEETNAALSSVLNLSGQDSTPNLDILKKSSSKVPSLPSEPPLGLHEALKILKYQSYQEAYANNSSSSDTFEETQKLFKDDPSLLKINPSDLKGKEPEQLTEKIKKLKNEIVYLQLMAEQKEKEKIAIVCFKKYKEEILKRVCKAYAFSVQDHVRDWIFSRRENSGETKPPETSSKPSHAHKSRRTDTSRISETTKNPLDAIKELDPYPAPAPAHAASNHRPQSIHSPQHLPKNAKTHPSGEKVSTVETMVAKATENYGLDMRNLRDVPRKSPESSSSGPGTILQKALSTNSSRNSSPDQRRSWSPERTQKKPSQSLKPIQPVSSSPYPEPYNPIDMMMPQKSTGHKSSELYRNNAEISRSSKSFHASERSQIQSLLTEPVQMKMNRNPYRAWSIQSGGQVSEERNKHSKQVSNVLHQHSNLSSPSNISPVESPLQRQLNSHKSLSQSNFTTPSNLEISSYDHHSNHHEHQSRSSSVNNERVHDRKQDEDRRHHSYGPSSLASNSAMPYGGHIIRNNTSPLNTVLSSNKTSIPAAQGSSTSPDAVAATTPPLCMGCGLSNAKFLCSGCRKHWYCSSQCQTLRWPEHSRVCAGRMFSQSASSYS